MVGDGEKVVAAPTVAIPVTVPSDLMITVEPLGITPLATKLDTPDSTPVSDEPSPAYDVAVTTPVKNPSPSELNVTPDPTITEPVVVEPDTFTFFKKVALVAKLKES